MIFFHAVFTHKEVFPHRAELCIKKNYFVHAVFTLAHGCLYKIEKINGLFPQKDDRL